MDRKEYMRQYCQNHKDGKREYNKQWRKEHPEQHREHGKKYYQNHKERLQEKSRKYRKEHIEQSREHSREYHQKFKLKLFEKLGNKCCRCGFSDARALQIDHVHGHGTRELRNMPTQQYYKKVLADTKGNYQLLCANCNWIKRHENKEERKI